ncbi:hypothetical protein [Chryseobacterium sp. A301]
MKAESHLAAFFYFIARSKKLTPTHISIYLCLCHQWSAQNYTESFQISRREIMSKSRIQSNSTYHRCIQDLQAMDLILYFPSYHPKQGSLVYVKPLGEIPGREKSI